MSIFAVAGIVLFMAGGAGLLFWLTSTAARAQSDLREGVPRCDRCGAFTPADGLCTRCMKLQAIDVRRHI